MQERDVVSLTPSALIGGHELSTPTTVDLYRMLARIATHEKRKQEEEEEVFKSRTPLRDSIVRHLAKSSKRNHFSPRLSWTTDPLTDINSFECAKLQLFKDSDNYETSGESEL
jgi:hypothetical protein